MNSSLSRRLCVSVCLTLLITLAWSMAAAQTTVQVATGTYSRTTAYTPPVQVCGDGTSNCRFSEFPGTFIMPNGTLMLAFNLETGPTSPALGRTFMPETSLNSFRDGNGKLFTHTFPAPTGKVYFDKGRDHFGLSGACPASPALPTTQKCSLIVYRQYDGVNWTTWRTDAFQALAPHPYAPQATVALPNGTIMRRVNGDDLRNLGTSVPKTAMLQALIPSGGVYPANWPTLGATGQDVFPDPDPTLCKTQISRIRKLSDDRYIALGQVWKYKNGATSGPCDSADSDAYSNLLLVAASYTAVQQGQWTLGMPYVPASTLVPNEWDAAELDNGDLLAVFRTQTSPTNNTQIRKQARLVKTTGAACPNSTIPCWVMNTSTLSNPGNFPHSGHPELLSTVQNNVRIVIHFADVGGVSYTVNNGASWSPLTNGGTAIPTNYYPRSIQDSGGQIYVFSWVGGDNPYGGLSTEVGGNYSGINQSIIMQKLKLTVNNPPSGPPTVSTTAATGVSSNAATLNGTVNPNVQATNYFFQYGTTTSYGTNTPTVSAGSGTSSVAVSRNLTSLAPNTTYHFRIVATNASGTTNGLDRTFTTSASGGTSYFQTVLNSNPVSYWRLGETSGTTAVDQKNSNPGTYTNGVTLGVTGATPGNTAASFDGSNDYVLAADSASLDTGDTFTAEAWIKPSLLGVSNTIINKFGSWFLYLDGANKLVLYKPSNGQIAISTSSISDTTNYHHVAVTKSGTTTRIYLDGVDVTGTVTNRTVANSTGGLYIGYLGGSPFHGVIDEVAIYSTALSATAIANHFAARNQ